MYAAPPLSQPLTRTSFSGEVRLWTTNQERDELDYKANLYSIIKAATALERAYSNDAVAEKEYHAEMSKLIAHYKSVRASVRDLDVQAWMRELRVDAQAGYDRLEAGFPSVQKSSNPKVIAETVQLWITVMDSLKLNIVAVDEIQPLVKDLVESLHKCQVDASFDGAPSVEEWLRNLDRRKASDELNEGEVRQFLFDLEAAYNAFHRALK